LLKFLGFRGFLEFPGFRFLGFLGFLGSGSEVLGSDVARWRMLFATTTLAARIEATERDTVADFGRQARARGRDVLIEEIGGGVAVYAGAGQPFNKVAGLGFAGEFDERTLAQLEAQYDVRGGEIRVELATLAAPSIATLLTSRGYRLIGHENVLGMTLTPERLREWDARVAASTAISVSRVERSDMRAWAETVIDGFMHPDVFDGPPPTESFERDALVSVFEDSTLTPGMSLYLARRDGEIAGGGSIRLSKGVVQMSGASTLPAHRRRGVQTTLLSARLADAARAGCDLAITCTEPASKSQENMQRAGFELLYSRALLVRAAPGRP
jgi:GNAT superfamily N-acetyltransferase